jgi:alkanesulfonate monooxygenase SsuD/methylene tetrahydromethanopterin reductase-like flavin-dependent oxidoreductase (luciferase family)
VAGYCETLGSQGAAILDHVLQCSAVGGPAKVAREMARFIARTGADELMLTSSIYDHQARKHSLTIAAEAMRDVQAAA